MKPIILIGLVLLVLVVNVFSADKKIVCYYGTWAAYRNGNGKFTVNDINPFLCTHLIYAFVGINLNGTIQVLDPWMDLEDNWGLGTMRKFNRLKEYNQELKTLVAIGGWNEGSQKYSSVAQNSALRARFAKDAAAFCLHHGFDGLDVDWEYPGQRDGDPIVDRENFVLFLANIRAEFEKSGLLLTAAVAATQTSASISYNIPEIIKYLDFINVMAYDLHGPWNPVTGHNAPLYSGPHDITVIQRELNVDSSIKFWLQSGAPAQKLVLGVPFYGRSFTLRSESDQGVGAATSGPGQGGQYTYESGFLGYNEICEKLEQSKWTYSWDDIQKVPYAYSGNQWVGYDDKESLSLKTDLIKKYDLGGAMLWSIETDDFLGKCGEKYVLLNTLVDNLNANSPPSTTSTTSGTTPTTGPTTTTRTSTITTSFVTTTQPTTYTTPGNFPTTTSTPSYTTNAPESFQCPGTGYFRDPYDCSKFYYCDGTRQFDFRCALGLYFDLKILACNWAHEVEC